MKAGGSKLKILKKLTKKADAILDWDNKKANPSIIKRIIGATNQETEYYRQQEEDFIFISDQLPEKGVDVIAKDEDGNSYCCFRCDCKNDNCLEWRCSLSGCCLMIKVIKWKYEN
jgi:Rad3-related DNA helicase